MAFKDLREFTDGAHIDLPIGGVMYRINDVDAETGLLVQRLMDAALEAEGSGGDIDVDEELLDDAREMRLYEDVLGDALEEMRDNGLLWSDIKRAATTAMIWIAFDEETAEKYWESGERAGEAAAPAVGQPPSGANRTARRASSASARKTRSRASTKPTRASTSTTRKTAPGSRGKTSGSSGT